MAHNIAGMGPLHHRISEMPVFSFDVREKQSRVAPPAALDAARGFAIAGCLSLIIWAGLIAAFLA